MSESELTAFVEGVERSLSGAARGNFGRIERMLLVRAMRAVGMQRYPDVVGDPSGERAHGECLCDVCGKEFFAHPMDWRLIGYGDVPFLNVLCDGRRVKL